MSDRSTAEQVEYEEEQRSPVREVKAGGETRQGNNLTGVEKVAFGIAAVFSALILFVCLSLTIVGFIFSPITDTLIFALLMGATGTTTYAIWRGGRRNAG